MISTNAIGIIVDAVGLLICAGYLAYRLRYRRLVVDHRLLFTVGFAYYISIPSLLARTRTFAKYYDFVWTLYHDIPAWRTLFYSCWSVLALICFHLGCALSGRLGAPVPKVPTAESMRSTRTWLLLACACSLLLFFAVAFLNRGIIQSGYRSNDPTAIQGEGGRGLMAAASTTTAALMLLYRSRLRDTPWPMGSITTRTRVRNLWLVALLTPIILLLLATGGRLYATTIIVAVIVWYTTTVIPLRRSVMILFGILGFFSLTAYGSLRTGSVPSASEVSLYGTAESVQGSISLYNILGSDERELEPFRAPIFLASDLINLAPRVVLPTKDELRITPDERGFVLDNPLGGTNVGLSLLLNFGSVGSLVVVLVLGLGLSRLRLHSLAPTATVMRAVYALISSTLLVGFFRDQFSITIVRWWILICVVVIGSATLMMRWMRSGPTGWKEVPPEGL